MNTPTHTKTIIERHEWTIGEESMHTTYRDLMDGIHVAKTEMGELGVDTTSDDAFHARAGDGGEIILYVDIERKETR